MVFDLSDPHFVTYRSVGCGPTSLFHCSRELCMKSQSLRRGEGAGTGEAGGGERALSSLVPQPLAWGFSSSWFCASTPRPHGHGHQSALCMTLWCRRLALLRGAAPPIRREPLSPPVCMGRASQRSAASLMCWSPLWAGLSSPLCPRAQPDSL